MARHERFELFGDSASVMRTLEVISSASFRGARVRRQEGAPLVITFGPTFQAWYERIELSVEPIEPDRCVLDVRSSTPLQFYDWGSRRGHVKTIRAALAGAGYRVEECE
jgi:uncharacterized protein (DUF1499 family)